MVESLADEGVMETAEPVEFGLGVGAAVPPGAGEESEAARVDLGTGRRRGRSRGRGVAGRVVPLHRGDAECAVPRTPEPQGVRRRPVLRDQWWLGVGVSVLGRLGEPPQRRPRAGGGHLLGHLQDHPKAEEEQT